MTEQPNGAEPQRQQVVIPPLMAQVPASFNVLELQRADGVTQTVLLVNSANGTFGFPIDPGPAREIGKNLIASADRSEAAVVIPPSMLLGPGGNPISFGPGTQN